MASGQIYKIHSDFYYVDDGIDRYECKIREVLKNERAILRLLQEEEDKK